MPRMNRNLATDPNSQRDPGSEGPLTILKKPAMSSEETSNEEAGCGIQYATSKRHNFRVLERFATPRWALAFLSATGFLLGFVISGLVNVVITTLEKRFNMRSRESGFIVSSYNFASLLAIPFVTYLGGRGHKPLWIGWGIVVMGLGCFVFSLPHFTTPPYDVSALNDSVSLCDQLNSTSSGEEEDNLQYYVFVFVLGQVLVGVGSSPLYTLGMTYLDENVSQKSSSLYHSVYYSVATALGPACGYILGGYMLKLFTEIGTQVPISDDNPSWVGAWWLGFIISGSLLVTLAVPILMLPRELPGTEELRANRETQVYESSADDNPKINQKQRRHRRFLTEFLVLLRNPPFIFTSMSNALDLGIITGFAAFTPKFLESMYSLTPTQASVILGGIVVAAGALGTILGGVIVSKAELKIKGIMKFCLFNTAVALACSFVFFIRCPNQEFAGATLPYVNSTIQSSSNFSSSCNEACICTTDDYRPVCGDDGVTYFSSCFAGCRNYVNESFTECSCVVGSEGNVLGSAKLGKCSDSQCSNMPTFLAIFFIFVATTIMCWTPNLQIVVRIVPFDLRSLAVGIQWMLNRAIGGIPIPIVMGQVLDLACSVWRTEGEDGASCRMYFNDQMAFYLFLVILAHKVCGLAFYSLSLFLYKTLREDTKERKTTDAETSVT